MVTAGRVHAGIDAREAAQLAHDAAGAERGECEATSAMTSASRTARGPPTPSAAVRVARNRLHIHARCHDRRGKAGHDRGDDADEEKREGAPVESDFVRAWNHGSADRHQQIDGPPGDCRAARPAGEREQQALREELPQQPRRARPERRPGDHLVRADRTAQQQVGDVRARGGEHEADRGEQQPQRSWDRSEHFLRQRPICTPVGRYGPGDVVGALADGVEIPCAASRLAPGFSRATIGAEASAGSAVVGNPDVGTDFRQRRVEPGG